MHGKAPLIRAVTCKSAQLERAADGRVCPVYTGNMDVALKKLEVCNN